MDNTIRKGAYADTYLPLAGGTLAGALNANGSVAIKGPRPWVDVMATGLTRKCAASLTATTGTITSGTNSLVVASATGWEVNMGIAVIRDDNVLFTSYVTAIVGTTFTLNDNATGTATAKAVYHDDTLAIQDAIDFASSLGRVYMPGGQYYITTLSLRGGVTLEGGGQATTQLVSLPGNTASAMLQLVANTTSNASVSGMLVNGSKTASPAPTCGGVLLSNTGANARRHKIRDVRIASTAGTALKLINVLYAHFTDVLIDTCDGHGIWEDGGCFFNVYENIHILDMGLHGVNMLGLGFLFTNLFVSNVGLVTAASDCFYQGGGSHAGNVHGFWFAEGGRSCLHIDCGADVNAGGQTVFAGSTHQNNAAEHVRITSGNAVTIRVCAVSGVTRAATSLLNVIGGLRCYVEIGYISTSNVLAANAAPAIGAGLSGLDHYIKIFDGAPQANGDINVCECDQLIVTKDWTRVSPSTLWRYPGSSVVRIPN